MKLLNWMMGGVAAIGVFSVVKMVRAKGNAPQTTAEIPFKVGSVLLVNLADPRVVHSPTTTLDFTNQIMVVISMQSLQGPDFFMAKKEGTNRDPNEFILSVPRSAVIRDMSAIGGGIGL